MGIIYHPRTLSPKERAEIANLRAENAELKKIVESQMDALIELADLVTNKEDGGAE